ncbi:hypothetical protein M427DRAFT_67804 [Gonapodya prolifera JEL478]|uniref:Uncharacterized protein n=1 Tax=Gonapodya prolifera (strain JEL478) TaxID=1344416 RepID=A0A139AP08_GONPJ|nr:hypothetical protein M427DRAFT_67804 [Gonapodya prolifera JEL478]|eukprot:KXS18374.1 hypothetical protein M427DRAFT_67804 [Gonapodya prolifera JEL478]
MDVFSRGRRGRAENGKRGLTRPHSDWTLSKLASGWGTGDDDTEEDEGPRSPRHGRTRTNPEPGDFGAMRDPPGGDAIESRGRRPGNSYSALPGHPQHAQYAAVALPPQLQGLPPPTGFIPQTYQQPALEHTQPPPPTDTRPSSPRSRGERSTLQQKQPSETFSKDEKKFFVPQSSGNPYARAPSQRPPPALSDIDASLIAAVEARNLSRVKDALSRGARPSARKWVRFSCRVYRDWEVRPGGNVVTRDLGELRHDVTLGESALACAIMCGHVEIVQALLQGGADANDPVEWQIYHAHSPWTHDDWTRKRCAGSVSYNSALAFAVNAGRVLSSDGLPIPDWQRDLDGGHIRVNKKGGVVRLLDPQWSTERCDELRMRVSAEVVRVLVRKGGLVTDRVIDAARRLQRRDVLEALGLSQAQGQVAAPRSVTVQPSGSTVLQARAAGAASSYQSLQLRPNSVVTAPGSVRDSHVYPLTPSSSGMGSAVLGSAGVGSGALGMSSFPPPSSRRDSRFLPGTPSSLPPVSLPLTNGAAQYPSLVASTAHSSIASGQLGGRDGQGRSLTSPQPSSGQLNTTRADGHTFPPTPPSSSSLTSPNVAQHVSGHGNTTPHPHVAPPGRSTPTTSHSTTPVPSRSSPHPPHPGISRASPSPSAHELSHPSFASSGPGQLVRQLEETRAHASELERRMAAMERDFAIRLSQVEKERDDWRGRCVRTETELASIVETRKAAPAAAPERPPERPPQTQSKRMGRPLSSLFGGGAGLAPPESRRRDRSVSSGDQSGHAKRDGSSGQPGVGKRAGYEGEEPGVQMVW